MFSCALNALSDGTASTEIGTISTSRSPNSNWALVNSHSSSVQVLVKARGKNASRTFFSPRRSDRVNFSPLVELAVKSGAVSPACGTFCSSRVVMDPKLINEGKNDDDDN